MLGDSPLAKHQRANSYHLAPVKTPLTGVTRRFTDVSEIIEVSSPLFPWIFTDKFSELVCIDSSDSPEHKLELMNGHGTIEHIFDIYIIWPGKLNRTDLFWVDDHELLIARLKLEIEAAKAGKKFGI